MTPDRYRELQDGPVSVRLTKAEIDEGWHFCVEMDGLLCGRGSWDCFCTEPKVPRPTHVELDDFFGDNHV
ncbi:MAG: hypothetical protein ACXABD_19055 [Candidatus Thorarchaeota archaeon]|jgi:hypothetical protein